VTYFDDNEDRLIYGRKRHRDNDYEPDPDHDNKVCQYCGKAGLYWLPVIRADGRTDYLLHEPGNRRHKCEISTDDFDVVKE
jgi:hypothetical protein